MNTAFKNPNYLENSNERIKQCIFIQIVLLLKFYRIVQR